MNFLRTSLEQIRQTLGAMGVQSRIAAGSLVALVVFSLAWIVHTAASPDMVRVYNAPLAGEELLNAEDILKNKAFEVDVVDGYLMVPAASRVSAQAALAEREIVPAAEANDVTEMALQPSLWRTQGESERLWEHATQVRLSALISEFTDIAEAQVIIQKGQAKGLGTRYIPGSVSVHLTMDRGRMTTPKMRRAIADVVIPAVPGLKRSDVRIIDATNNQSFVMTDQGESGDERLETVDSWENHYRRNLSASLSYIPNVLVGVFVEPDPTKEIQTQQRTYGEPVSAKIESNSDSVEGAGGVAVEPGVRANTNTGVSIPTSNVGRGGSRESNETVTDVRFPETITKTIAGPAGVKKISVSVGVPYSYLVQSFQAISGDSETKPTDADIDQQLVRITDHVVNLIGAPDRSLVNVSWFVDGAVMGEAAPVQAGLPTVLAANGKSITLGVLAVLSLMMVMMFARRRVPDPPILEQPVDPNDMLDTALDALGSGEGALEGIELDEEAIRSQKIVEQVREMVMERPESATNLIRRWIEQN